MRWFPLLPLGSVQAIILFFYLFSNKIPLFSQNTTNSSWNEKYFCLKYSPSIFQLFFLKFEGFLILVFYPHKGKGLKMLKNFILPFTFLEGPVLERKSTLPLSNATERFFSPQGSLKTILLNFVFSFISPKKLQKMSYGLAHSLCPLRLLAVFVPSRFPIWYALPRHRLSFFEQIIDFA